MNRKYCYPQVSKRRAKKAQEIQMIDSPHLQEIREKRMVFWETQIYTQHTHTRLLYYYYGFGYVLNYVIYFVFGSYILQLVCHGIVVQALRNCRVFSCMTNLFSCMFLDLIKCILSPTILVILGVHKSAIQFVRPFPSCERNSSINIADNACPINHNHLFLSRSNRNTTTCNHGFFLFSLRLYMSGS